MTPEEVLRLRNAFASELDDLLAEYALALGPIGEGIVDLDAYDAEETAQGERARPHGWAIVIEYVDPVSVGSPRGIQTFTSVGCPPWMTVAHRDGLFHLGLT